MINKKITVLAIATILLITIFTACGKKDTAKEETTTSELTTLSAPEESTSEETTTAEAESATDPAATEATQANNSDGSNSNQAPAKPTQALETTLTSIESQGTYGWTRAQAEAFVSKSRIYGESIGLIWDDSFSIEAQNACWNASVATSKKRSEDKIFTQMKEQLNDHKNGARQAKYFKIIMEENEPTEGNWEFTILYL